MRKYDKLGLGLIACTLAMLSACAPKPSLNDPYEANDYFWPYDYGVTETEQETSVCDREPNEPLGILSDGTPVLALNECDPTFEGDFPICARINEDGILQVEWDGANGFAIFVTEPQAVIPTGPGVAVSEGETFWSIGPIDFPTEGFSSPLTYQELPEGMEDVTTDHGGPNGGTPLESGRCYKITAVNTVLRRSSVVVGWQ